MTTDRLDELLDLELMGDDLPDDLTSDEREELDTLLQARLTLESSKESVEAELNAALPVAKARFERFLSVEQQPASVNRGEKQRGWFGRALAIPRFAAIGAPALALGAIAVLALFLLNSSFRDVDVAVALSEGDYVQFEGTIGKATTVGDRVELTLDSGAGSFQVTVAGNTRILRDGFVSSMSALTPGAVVVVDGVVGGEQKVVAGNVLFGTHVPPEPARLQQYDGQREPIRGGIVLFRLPQDGLVGELVLQVGPGRRVVIPVDGHSLESLLRRFSTALGETVVVTPIPGSPLFRIEVPGNGVLLEPPTPADGRPALVTLRGVVLEFGPDGAVLVTQNGRENVIVTPETKILGQDSGLTPLQLGDRNSIVGHGAAVVGFHDEVAGGFVADLVIIGQSAAPPQR